MSDEERARIDRMLAFYGAFPAAYLSKLTHHETPWKDARLAGQRSGRQSPSISAGAIRAFYGGKTPEGLEADYQMSVAIRVMDEHAESLTRLAQ